MPGFYDITPFTLLDYPGEMACIAWFAGCNMRCVYCHNPDIVSGKGVKDEKELFAFLEKRIGKLSGVVFSGGEATLTPELPGLIRQTKAMGFKIKLDTNGSRPEILKGLLEEGLLDYVAMDFKSPPEKARSLIGTAKLFEPFCASLAILSEAGKNGLRFEIRTTIHPDLLDEADLSWMIAFLDEAGYRGTYYLQLIQATGEKTIGNVGVPEKTFDRAKLPQPKGFQLGFRNFKEPE